MDLHTHLPYRLARLSLNISRSTTERYVQTTEISAREWRALGMLGIRGAMTPTDLSASTGMGPATITRAASHLEKLGLIRRIRNKHDNRSQILQLTPKGTARCAEITPKTAKSGELCANLYTAAEFALLIEFLDRLDQAIADGLLDRDE